MVSFTGTPSVNECLPFPLTLRVGYTFIDSSLTIKFFIAASAAMHEVTMMKHRDDNNDAAVVVPVFSPSHPTSPDPPPW
jgi:hypothetical protein